MTEQESHPNSEMNEFTGRDQGATRARWHIRGFHVAAVLEKSERSTRGSVHDV